MVWGYILTLLALLSLTACQECVKYDFEDDFSQRFGFAEICHTLVAARWRQRFYNSTAVTSPHELSSRFITPSTQMSCTTSFPFTMEAGGFLQVNVQLRSFGITVSRDQIAARVYKKEASGPDSVVSSVSTTRLETRNGPIALNITIPETAETFEGYLVLTGTATARSIALVDSFRYLPPGMDENDCIIYEFPEGHTETPTEEPTEEPLEELVEECVKYDFEDDFSQRFGFAEICHTLVAARWRQRFYNSTAITSPHELSSQFITPSTRMSCTTSFPFTMQAGGFLQVNVQLRSFGITVSRDQIAARVYRMEESGPDRVVSSVSTTRLETRNGPISLNITIPETADIFKGYIVLTGTATAGSISLVDSFRYIPHNMDEGACIIYETSESEETTPAPEGDESEEETPAPEGDKPEGETPAPEGDDSEGETPAPEGDTPEGETPAPEGDKPEGETPTPEGDKPEGETPAPEGDKPEGETPAPEGDDSEGETPAPEGDKPEGETPAPEGDKPEGETPAPEGDKPEGETPAPEGDKPEGETPAPEGEKPEGETPDPEGDESEEETPAPEGDKPEGETPAPEGDKPEGETPAPEGDKPEGETPTPEGDKPEGETPAPEGDKPEGETPAPEGDDSEGETPAPEGDKPEGETPAPEGDKPEGETPAPEGDHPEEVKPIEICQVYDFNNDFKDRFSRSGTCRLMLDWDLKDSWDELPGNAVQPHEMSNSFISSGILSCTSSFVFNMSFDGTLEINVYMQTKGDIILATVYQIGDKGMHIRMNEKEIEKNTNDGQWHVLKIPLSGSENSAFQKITTERTFKGYVTIIGKAAAENSVLVDSFRFYTPNVENDCKIYDDDVADETMKTTVHRH